MATERPKRTTSQTTRKQTMSGRRPEPREARPGGDRPPGRNALERGDIFFFYRPGVEEESPQRLLDVRRFQVVLRPEGRDVLRLITIGRKRLPGSGDGDRNHWGFVDRVFRAPEDLRDELAGATYETESRGERHLPAARPAGEGVYALARRGRNSVLAYALELPEQPGAVQEAFGIEPRGQFVLAVKNPEAASPPGIGLDDDRRADFPGDLRAKFGDRKWVAADPPEFLDHEGAELVLIGGRDAGEDLGLDLEPQPEDKDSAEVFGDLGLERSDRTVKPLFEGAWE